MKSLTLGFIMKKLGKKSMAQFESVSSLANANNGNCSCTCLVSNTRYSTQNNVKRKPA